MGRSVSSKKKRERVNEVLNEFNLETCKNVKIGIPGRIKGISGGQKRRLAFATEACNLLCKSVKLRIFPF